MKSEIPNLYERLSELLGKPETDPLFVQLLKDVGEAPKLHDEIVARWYDFAGSGFTVWFFALYDCFNSVNFRTRPFFSETPYKGDLPFTILTSDTRDKVQSKLGKTPIRSGLTRGSQYSSDCHYDVYQLDHLELKFDFDAGTGVMRFAGLTFPGAQDRHEAREKFLSEHPDFKPRSIRAEQLNERGPRKRPGGRHRQSET